MISLTIFFDGQFYVGMFESINNGSIRICKVVFGSKPKDYEIFEYIKKYYSFLKFSTLTTQSKKYLKVKNPKRLQRLIKKSVKTTGIGTKSQQLLKNQREINKLKTKSNKIKNKRIYSKLKYEMRIARKKEKMKGH